MAEECCSTGTDQDQMERTHYTGVKITQAWTRAGRAIQLWRIPRGPTRRSRLNRKWIFSLSQHGHIWTRLLCQSFYRGSLC
ncbi:uncharacterized protein LOC121840718 isoform X3 [Oncorhynchus tshawytscha]|uniref:uncharacterized protein LOC121840718 isoform X3 n=1 Tax=Oncorhynchus tshawytscha TaxID=74940 RepID=UPI001C3DD711|nr:uncharacterized protein LOC121840718 isoform X3 [Oncorhynchus tshawytscha]